MAEQLGGICLDHMRGHICEAGLGEIRLAEWLGGICLATYARPVLAEQLGVSLDHMRGHYCEAEWLSGTAWPSLAKSAWPNSIISLKSLQLHSIDAFPLLNYAFSFAYALDVFVLAICLVIFLT